MMTQEDLNSIRQQRYVENGFDSLGIGIVIDTPVLFKDGSIGVSCEGIHRDDAEEAADRIAQEMGRRGWDVDVWLDTIENELKIDHPSAEDYEPTDTGTYGERKSWEDARVTVTEFLDDFYDDAEDNYNQAFSNLERRLQEYFNYEPRDTENDRDE